MRIRDTDYNIGCYNRRSEVTGQWSEVSGQRSARVVGLFV